MKTTRFGKARDLIVVGARVFGRGGQESRLSLAVDTGSVETVIAPETADDLGYSARDGEEITTVRSAIGKEQGYTLLVTRLNCEFRFADGEIRVEPIAPS